MKKLILIALALSLQTVGTHGSCVLSPQNLSPNVQALLMQRPDSRSDESVKLFISLEDDAIQDLESLGAKITVSFDGIVSADVPLNAIPEIAALPAVSYINCGYPVHLCMDKVRASVGMTKIENEYIDQPYDGTGVVVGIIDTGLEYDHVDFRDADGQMRIRKVWSLAGFGKSPEKYGYGAEYTSPDEIRAAITDTQSEYHGTHVTGIAAGSDRTSKYYGMAPGADIVFVAYSSNTTANLPDAIQYIYDYADEVGKPCVINMSLGAHVGPHDGTSELDRYISSVTGPGRVIVGAAGNEGEANMHVRKELTADDNQAKTLLGFAASGSKNSMVDVWGSAGTKFTFQVVIVDALKGRLIEASDPISTDGSVSTSWYPKDDNVECYFNITAATDPYSKRPNANAECYITSISDNRAVGVIVTGEDGQVIDMYNVGANNFVNGGLRGWLAGTNEGTIGEIGGTSKDIITVGSYNTRYTFPLWASSNPMAEYQINGYGPDYIPVGAISSFSSQGPTADGRIKPDVVAPGALVVSAINKRYSGYSEDNFNQLVGRTVDGDGNAYYYDLNLGTSMASPVVTGTVALWLQADPTLTPDGVREIIQKTSRQDANTGAVPNNQAGYGKLDTYAGLKAALGESGIDAIEASGEKAWLEPGRQICVVLPSAATVEAWTVSGQLIARLPLQAGLNTLDASAWPSGLILLRLPSTTAKLPL